MVPIKNRVLLKKEAPLSLPQPVSNRQRDIERSEAI
jgi:hypothetical protein